jgi:hypothetical protein
MKSFKSGLFALSVLITAAACAPGAPSNSDGQSLATLQAHVPHLDLQMSGLEGQALLDQQPELLTASDAQTLKPVLELGKRNLDWLKHINLHRDPAHPVSLSSKETQQGYPIEQPSESNVQIVMSTYNQLKAELPHAMAQVLLNGQAFTDDLPLDEKDYILWGAKVDRVYQSATRWLLELPYLSSYIAFRQKDIRGYYYLSKEADLATKLANWSQLDASLQANLRSWLIGMCANSRSRAECTRKLDKLISTQGDIQGFHDQYVGKSRELFESYFSIQRVRGDIEWTSAHPDVLHMPFRDPKSQLFRDYLKGNIEDEWKWGGWRLSLDFEDGFRRLARLVLEPGVTPHVDWNQDTITIDSNQPTTEYGSQWMIRHEFGHILGFVDCYAEFYEEERGVMVSYQIDTSDLMCSRKGALKQNHFDELKRVYFDR